MIPTQIMPALIRIRRLPMPCFQEGARSRRVGGGRRASAPLEDVTGPLSDRAECPLPPLVSCPRNNIYFAGSQLAVFQGANERSYLNHTGRESNAEKRPTGSGPSESQRSLWEQRRSARRPCYLFFSIDKSALRRITKGLLSALNESEKNLCHNRD